MDFPKHSILQALSVMVLAWMLVRCQIPVQSEEEEEELAKEADNATVGTITCPSECSCSAEGSVDCAGIDLTEFPEELSEKTKQLSLQNNMIKQITMEHISHLHHLETLNLQNNWLTTDGLEDEGFETLEKLAYLYLANNKGGVTEPTDAGLDTSSPQKKSTMEELFGETFTDKDVSKTVTDTIKEEVTSYQAAKGIPVDGDPLEWWKINEGKYPHIAMMAKHYLAVPATSVPSERVFSTAGDIVTAKRSMLSPDSVDTLIFLKKNLKL